LKNYDVFIDSNLNKFLSFKYFKAAYKGKNIFATLNLADFYQDGFGELNKNSTKAVKLYRKVIQSGSENSFYVAHAYFNLGIILQNGDGIEKNVTKAMRFYNLSISNEPSAYYPSLLMKLNSKMENMIIKEILFGLINSFISKFTNPSLLLYGICSFLIFYCCFFVSLYYQKE
jgi:TPR repeat protein